MTTGERGPTIEILQLLERLEQLVTGGTRVPLTSKALVDEQEFVDILEEIRSAIPEEVRLAKRLSQEKDKVMLQAQAEADKILGSARDEAARILEEDELLRAAREQADRYVQDAVSRAEDVRRGADQYALLALDGLEDQLTRLLATVKRGKATLERSVHGSLNSDDSSGESEAIHEPSRAR